MASIANETSEVVSSATAPAMGRAGPAQRDQRHDRQRGQLEGDQPGAEVAGGGDGGGAGGRGEHQADGDGGAPGRGLAVLGPGQQQRDHGAEQGGELERRGDGRGGVEARGRGLAGRHSVRAASPGRRAQPGDRPEDAEDEADQGERVVGAPQPGREDVQDEDRSGAQRRGRGRAAGCRRRR